MQFLGVFVFLLSFTENYYSKFINFYINCFS